MHDLPIEDLTEMVQEEISKIMLLIKPQKVISASVEIIGWFIKLHPEMDIKII